MDSNYTIENYIVEKAKNIGLSIEVDVSKKKQNRELVIEKKLKKND